MTLPTESRDVLRDGGALARRFAEYEERPQQLAMTEAVAEAFEQRQTLVVEAATGTGKTLAYLVPALLSRRRTIVSTATRNLQDQLFEKDIPQLAAVMSRPIKASLLKGRQNYLCWWQYEQFAGNPRFRRVEDAALWPTIADWADHTESGDRAEVPEMPDDYPTWSDLSVGADACLGRECRHWDRCFVVRARQKAADADVVVVNHHLFFADLSLRRTGKAELLPPTDAVVFDEAHHLEEVAAGYFGVQVSSWRVIELLRDTIEFLKRENAVSDVLKAAVEVTREAARLLWGWLVRDLPDSESRVELGRVLEGYNSGPIRDATLVFEQALERVAQLVAATPRAGEVGTRLVERARTLLQELSLVLHRESKDLVYLLERRGQGVYVQATPIDVSRLLRELLPSADRTQIFTSATLTTDGDFRFVKNRLGLAASARELRLDPVFDYPSQAMLYAPAGLPDPNDSRFIEAVAPTMLDLVRLTEGRAFLLFTSYRNMRRAWEILSPKIEHRVLVQGEMGRAALLEEFRRDVHSVLFATSSFWEGVDVQGEALSLVVIDKLPFASPGDPLVAARVKQIEDRGGSGFSEYQVPGAAIALKQGVGRLIRHRDDFGIIAILDNRLVQKSYGARFIRSLPPLKRAANFEAVQQWWADRVRQNLAH